MTLLQPILNSFAVDILTSHYRVYGELRTRGDPTLYLNAPEVSALSVHDATILPLREGMRISPMMVDELYLPKLEPQIITLGAYVPEIKPLPKTEKMICFTDAFLLRGTFHMGPETQAQDVFFSARGAYFYVTNLDVHALFPLTVEVKASAELAFINGGAVRAFYVYQGDT